ncbi:E3 ubiquitin-protein ligase UPL1 isoform X1 [Tripterygium wilfordii]|uniref:HECT-type E3 ubiquitin transferase n=1 Tax=Tripterygium wilfordii TaxID=458696 RepID=A0A7J7C2T7_TRIWF|nr:E3 ubiquitin-protein ligase UPL1 isoform X2 [Tripterygium wilfordii]KAF5728469.1 E3 ubiquitin-protein ligase UPL1 isoform X1 [Tripterygium wilfordii]
MKLKKRRAVEVPPKIKSFIGSVIATPLENIEEPLKTFVWEFDKGDFHHWVDLFTHFDSFFEKHIKSRKDLLLEDNFLDSDPSFPREAILQILRVIRIILENCTNKHFYSSYEHLSSLLACTNADVVEACLQTLAAFLKKTIGKYSIRDSSLSSKLFSLAQGWGGKEEGLGLIACAMERGCDPIAYELGCTLHFEFYAVKESSTDSLVGEQLTQGLQIIHLPNINSRLETDLELLDKLVTEYKVPSSLRFSLLTRLRFARAFSSLATRQQYTCICLYAFIVLVQASNDADDLVSFFNSEPEFVNELVSLLSYEDAVPEKIRILSLLSLVALSQDRSRQQTVLTALTSGGHRGILSSLMQKAVKSVISNTSKWSVVFAEALLSLVIVLSSSSSGCSAMREAGFISTLLPLLKDTDPQHLHLVSTAVHILEAFMDYSNPAVALFRELGGLDDTISRLKIEVSRVENGSTQQGEDPTDSVRSFQLIADASSELDDMRPLYSEALVSYHRRLLIKALLHAISLGTYAPGNNTYVYGSEESLLPECLCIIFRRAKDFGGGVFALAATVMSDLIHKDPTCFPALDAAGLPSAFLDAIMDGVLCSCEAIKCIPQCLDALCLNNIGLQAVKDRNALRCFVKIFTSRTYLRALGGDTTGSLSSGLDELMRHASSLRGQGVDAVIEILNAISKVGSGNDASYMSLDPGCSSAPVPMETDTEEKSQVPSEDGESSKMDCVEQITEQSSDSSAVNIELFLPECVSNAARLLETILQNADTCRIFVEKKGVDAVLQLLTLPLMPLSASVGQNISVAFKNFSAQHYAALARTVCSFLRENLKSTNELLNSVGGTQLAVVESLRQTKVLRCLSSLEGIISLSNFLLKGTTTVVSELGASESDVLKDLGKTYREIIWQISLCNDSKVDEKRSCDQEPASTDAAPSSAGRESDDDGNIPMVRYMNPVSIRSSSQSLWGGERDFLSVVRSGEGLHRRSRHGLTRIRVGRGGRHTDALNVDSEIPATVPETSCSQDAKKKSPDVLVFEILSKLASTMRSFFTALVKGFTSPSRRRADAGSLSSASKTLGTALAKTFLEALCFSGYPTSAGLDTSLSVKCRYLGKVVDDMAALTFDVRRRTCYTTMVNNFYVHGTFKELLTTFEATSQLLWTLPYSTTASGIDHEKAGEGSKLSHSTWLLDTLKSYCRELEYFVNSSLLLSSVSASQVQLLVQPVAVGLSIGLFPVPRDPEIFVRMLQAQVLDVILRVWNHPMFPNCSPGFIASIISLVAHVYSGVGDVKRTRIGIAGSTNQRFLPPPPDETTIATIVEMGFPRARAEEALRRVETNNVEMAMEWLFTHAEDPVQEDDELARALALSLGSSSEASKVDSVDKSPDVMAEELQTKAPPVDDILAASMKLFQSSDQMAFLLTDLLVTLCNRNKGEDRPRVATYLIQQMKVCQFDFSKDTTPLSMISHIIALLLSEDGNIRDIAAQNGIVPAALDILMSFKAGNASGNEILSPKCISSLLLVLDSLLQSRPRIISETPEENQARPSPDTSIPVLVAEEKSTSDVKEGTTAFEEVLGKSTGFLTVEESQKVLLIACDLVKQHVPAVIMQAVLQICARLTKTHALALQFLENGGLAALFSLPRSCFFPGYDSVASAIIRHLLEDPQTLQTAMELEIRQTLSANRHAGRLSPRAFLTSMAPVISRDPAVFMKAAAAVCQLDSSGGRTFVVLLKEKEKEKEKSKAPGMELGLSSNEPVRISESKLHDGSNKCTKGHKKIPTNITQVIDQLLEIVLKYPLPKSQDDCKSSMEVDEPTTKVKGKSKVDENETLKKESESEKSAALAKITFVLKLLSDILLMYVHAAGVILRRDLEMGQLRGSNQTDSHGHGGIVYHVLHRLLPVSTDKSAGPDEWRDKLSEKASWFLVVLCGRSGEGRRRVINELAKALSSFSNSVSNSTNTNLLPDKKVFALADLAYSILSKNASSANLPGSGCSPDIAKSMIDGGMIRCLTGILQVIDLDHPDAPKIVNLILKSLESLTRAANSSEQIFKSEELMRKRSAESSARHDDHITILAAEITEPVQNSRGLLEVADAVETEQEHQGTTLREGNRDPNADQTAEQEMRIEAEQAMAGNQSLDLGMSFMHEGIEESGVLGNPDQIEMTFRVENRADDDIVDEDDDMGDDGDDDEDDEEGDDEDEDIAEDGAGMMSLADTDMEDHDDTGLGDDFHDEMIDDEDDEFHENRVIEVRWREALDGLDHLQVLGQPGAGSGLINVAAEPFEGVNVDDLFGLRRPVAFERRRQAVRSSFERSATDVNGFQHPLLSRPSQSGDFGSVLSAGGNSSRELDTLSGGSFDVAHFYMFDAPVLPYDHASSSIFGDRLGNGAPPPLTDYSVGMDSLQLSGRRAQGDTRWTDDGQPQGSAQAAAIAQALEEQFLSRLPSISPVSHPSERASQNSGVLDQSSDAPLSNDGQVIIEGDNTNSQQSEGRHQENGNEVINQPNPSEQSSPLGGQVNAQSAVEDADGCPQAHEPMLIQPISLISAPNGHDSMEIGEDVGTAHVQVGGAISEFVNSSVESQAGLQFEASDSLHDVGVDGSSRVNCLASNPVLADPGLEVPASVCATVDVDMNGIGAEGNLAEQGIRAPDLAGDEPSSAQDTLVSLDASQAEQTSENNDVPGENPIDPTFLEALPEDLRAEVLASQQTQSVQPPNYVPPSVDDIDPEFLAALPPDIQAEVLAQQRAQRVAQQAEGQPVDMDNASIIATFPADLREEVLLTSSEAVLSALPSPLLAEAQMLRDRAMSHYHARSIFGSSHRLNSRRNGLGFDRQTVMDRGVGVTLGRRAASAIADSLKVKEIDGEPLVDADALKALIRLLRLAQPLGKGLLQRLLLNLCAHSGTRAILVRLLLDMIKPEADGFASGLATINSQRLYGCQSNVVYGRSQLLDGLPPLVLRRVLEILTYLATNHSAVARLLFYLDPTLVPEPFSSNLLGTKLDKGKEKVVDVGASSEASEKSVDEHDVPLILFLKLLNRPLLLRSTAQLEQVMGLLQVVVRTAASKLECQSQSEHGRGNSQELPVNEMEGDVQKDPTSLELESGVVDKCANTELLNSDKKRDISTFHIFLQLPQSDLRNLCHLLGHEGLSDKVYTLAGEVLKKLASVAASHRRFFTSELSQLAHGLSCSAVSELVTLRNTHMLGLSAGSMAGAATLRVLQALSSLISTSVGENKGPDNDEEEEEQITMLKLNVALEPLWQELSDCISMAETQLSQTSSTTTLSSINVGEHVQGTSSSPLPPGTQRLLPFIEAFFVLCEKLQPYHCTVQQDQATVTAIEVKEAAGSSTSLATKCSGDPQKKLDGAVTFSRFAEKHRRLLNAFIRQNPALLEKSLSMILKARRLIDFDNKKAYFRSRIRQQHEHHLTGPLRISVRRAYVLEDSYNQLRMRPSQDLKGRLNVQFQGEEGIDAGGLTREWYQLLSRVIFDKGALLFTTVGNNATFQPNPNSVYQTEHLSYFKFVGRVVAKALFDGQLLDVYFTRSFYKHILGVKVTYHDIEAVDPDYYKNLKWMLENDVSDIPDLTFSMDADEEKHILYEKTEVTDYELKPGGRNIRVTEETKHEYVDLVADHILTNAIRAQITSFLEGFNELVHPELISIFNDKELELLISGLPEIDFEDLKANTEYTGYTAASSVVQWLWEVVNAFSKEDMARLLQFVTGTSKVPLEGFKALQGISGPQRFQIHKAYGAPERLPSAHTCFNQLDLPEYTSKEQLQERLLLAIHEGSEGFGFG